MYVFFSEKEVSNRFHLHTDRGTEENKCLLASTDNAGAQVEEEEKNVSLSLQVTHGQYMFYERERLVLVVLGRCAVWMWRCLLAPP